MDIKEKKKVLISIHPKWCELIFNGRKTIEVRKSFPKQLETPFEVLVYCTKHSLTRTRCMYSYLHKNEPKACEEYGTITKWSEIGDVQVNAHLESAHRSYGMHGKVIGSFVCDKIDVFDSEWSEWAEAVAPCEGVSCSMPMSEDKAHRICKEQAILTDEDIISYFGDEGWRAAFWHITSPKLFDKPRELSEFMKPLDVVGKTLIYDQDVGYNVLACDGCDYATWNGKRLVNCNNKKCMQRRISAPQSWCYVEEER